MPITYSRSSLSQTISLENSPGDATLGKKIILYLWSFIGDHQLRLKIRKTKFFTPHRFMF